jgi:signal transduction histidine kinase
VIQNLASNALRHTPPGGSIKLGAARDGNRVRLTVTDTGVGIPEQHLPHVFDRFYKADQSRSQPGRGNLGEGGAGSGLGLSIVKAIVELHGGSIVAYNDQGAVFEIVLPATRSS